LSANSFSLLVIIFLLWCICFIKESIPCFVNPVYELVGSPALICYIYLHFEEKKSGFHALKRKKFEAKVEEKSTSLPSFICQCHPFLCATINCRAFTVFATTSHTSDFPTPLGTLPTTFFLCPSKPFSSFSSPNTP